MKLGITIALSCLLGGSALAQVSIDEFDSGPYDQTLTGTQATRTVAIQNGTMLGGQRFTSFRIGTNQLGDGRARLSIFSRPQNNPLDVLTMDSDTGVIVNDQVVAWGENMNGSFFGMDKDLTAGGGTALAVNVLMNDQASSMSMIAYDTHGAVKGVVQPMPAAGGIVTFNFASFTGVDFTNITGLELHTDFNQNGDLSLFAHDYQFDWVRTVPEPTSMIALVAGFGALLMRRRRKPVD